MIFCDEKIKTLGRRISDPGTANNRKASSLKTAQGQGGLIRGYIPIKNSLPDYQFIL